MSEVIINMYQPFRYGNETPESSLQTDMLPAVRIGSLALRWSHPDVESAQRLTLQNVPLQALKLEFSAPIKDESPLAPIQQVSYYPFGRSLRSKAKRNVKS